MTREEAIEFIAQSVKSDVDMAKVVDAIKALEQEPCEDAVSRKDIYFKLTNGAYPNETIEQFIDRMVKELEALPLVTPKCRCSEKPNKSEIPTGSDDCISRQAVEDAIYDATRSMDLNYGQIMEYIDNLPTITPIRPKGHWIEERNDYGEITHWHCDKCYEDSGFTTTCKWDYCPSCGADMRGRGMKIHLYKKGPIHFFYKGNDRVHLINWKFKIHWCRWNKKPFSKLHILIRTPLLCLERNNGGTAIGNKYVIWFIK